MERAAYFAAISVLLAGVSCGRMQLDSAKSGGDAGLGPSVRAAAEDDSGRQGKTEACGTAVHDAELWRHGLGQTNAATFVSVATDAEGHAFVSSALGETSKVDPAGKLEWSKPFGGMVAIGRAANIYVAGTFAETIDLDDCSLVAEGPAEAFLAELDAGGAVLHCSNLGGAEAVTGLVVDSEGDVVVSGPGLGTVKADWLGRVIWRRELSGRIAVDPVGNVFVTGALTGSTTFDDYVLESAGGEDVLLAKLSPQGGFLFASRFGDTAAVQHGEGIAVDPSGNVVVSGVSEGSVDFGGGAVTVDPSSCPAETWCKQAGFIVKFDASGAELWTRSRMPVRTMPGIASDSRGNVIVSGAYPGSAPPYRLPLLVEFDSAGNDVPRTIRPTSATTDAGAGFGVAFDACDNALWALAAPPAPSMNPPSFLAKLSP